MRATCDDGGVMDATHGCFPLKNLLLLPTPFATKPTDVGSRVSKARKTTYPHFLIPPDGDESSAAEEVQRHHQRPILILRNVTQQPEPMRVTGLTNRSHHVGPDGRRGPFGAVEGHET